MTDFENFIQRLIQPKKLDLSGKRASLISTFAQAPENIETYQQIKSNQNLLIDRFMKKYLIYDIINQHLQIPNARVNKFYEFKIDLEKLGNKEITETQIRNLEPYGVQYEPKTGVIYGTPIQSGDFKINLEFKIEGQNESDSFNIKPIMFVINADPKTLWKNIPSDFEKDDIWKEKNFWKPDNVFDFKPIGDKHIVVSSKRGRSHANVGSFRDDDFAFKHYDKSGWSVVCVADGAGSAKLSREGSKIACHGIIDYFSEVPNQKILADFDGLIKEYHQHPENESHKNLNLFLYNNLGKAALTVHKKLEEFANKLETPLKDLHSTLIFSLFKKYKFGYAILTFGVGDCPIGVINKDLTEIKLMNWLDVGEFGGGTRFITMPEIFSSDKFPTRFGFKLIDDFSYLILMTDGIYDPKFVVEANLEKLEKWQEFLNDLNGQNEDNCKVDFNPKNKEIGQQLSTWMDFWSPGNHDDRTLAIIF